MSTIRFSILLLTIDLFASWFKAHRQIRVNQNFWIHGDVKFWVKLDISCSTNIANYLSNTKNVKDRSRF